MRAIVTRPRHIPARMRHHQTRPSGACKVRISTMATPHMACPTPILARKPPLLPRTVHNRSPIVQHRSKAIVHLGSLGRSSPIVHRRCSKEVVRTRITSWQSLTLAQTIAQSLTLAQTMHGTKRGIVICNSLMLPMAPMCSSGRPPSRWPRLSCFDLSVCYVYVYMYIMYVCMLNVLCIRICIYVSVYINMYVHVFVFMHICVCMCVHAHSMKIR
jgi:hypothetical protein